MLSLGQKSQTWLTYENTKKKKRERAEDIAQ
jgi:hypothetical protein